MTFNRMRTREKQKLREIEDNAVRRSGRFDDLGRGGGVSISSVTTAQATVDENGNTLEGFMLWGDNWGSNWS